MAEAKDRILDRINTPADLNNLSMDELCRLAAEVREAIINTVSRTGGHLAPNLGVVELTIALLRVFRVPADKILWDVSHQTYAYKLLTDRKDRFDTLRQIDGIAGFSRRDESPYDAFGAGHSGTALSAALGMAAARDRLGGKENIVAVVGDGSLGCGISFEALNNLAALTRRFIAIVNDNEMSISANVGSVSGHLGKLLANPKYNLLKGRMERFVVRHSRKTEWMRQIYYRIEESIKNLFLHSAIFEEFGLRYIGPIDGHDIRLLISALEIARDSDKPILIHVSTRKGRGYSHAESDPEAWHSTSPFDVTSGKRSAEAGCPSYSDVFGRTIERLAEENPRVVAITAAMAGGTGLSGFAKRFPNRFFDVGIAEEHAVVFGAGLAAGGFIPFIPVYSTFAQRAVDCVIHDVCLQNLHVILCLDRAGIVGDDGPTHHGIFDIALFQPVPGVIIAQPKDEAELAGMLFSAVRWGRPTVIRYPRGSGPGAAVPEVLSELALGKAEVLRPGGEVQIWALGDMVPLAEAVARFLAGRGVDAGTVNARFVRPLDAGLLLSQREAARVVATIENGVVSGGFGSVVQECLSASGFRGRVLKFGWPGERFVPHGANDALKQRFQLVPEVIGGKILDALGSSPG